MKTAWNFKNQTTMLLASIIIALMLPTVAWAQDTGGPRRATNDAQDVDVFQRKPFLRKGRVELVPMFRMTFNDALVQQINTGLNLNYHITEAMSAGLMGSWQDWRQLSPESVGIDIDVRERIIDATDAIPDSSVLNGYFGAEFGYTPIYGKSVLFHSLIMFWELTAKAGGGTAHSRANEWIGAGTLAIEQRLYFPKVPWLSLNFEVRGLLYAEDIGDGTSLFQQWFAGVGIGFWIPFSFEYSSDITFDSEE